MFDESNRKTIYKNVMDWIPSRMDCFYVNFPKQKHIHPKVESTD